LGVGVLEVASLGAPGAGGRRVPSARGTRREEERDTRDGVGDDGARGGLGFGVLTAACEGREGGAAVADADALVASRALNLLGLPESRSQIDFHACLPPRSSSSWRRGHPRTAYGEATLLGLP